MSADKRETSAFAQDVTATRETLSERAAAPGREAAPTAEAVPARGSEPVGGDMPAARRGRQMPPAQQVDLKASFRRIWAYSRRYHRAFVIAAVLTVLSAVLSLLTPGYLSQFVDRIKAGMTSGMDFGLMGRTVALLAVLYVAGQLFGLLQSWIMGTATQRMGQELRDRLSEKICRLPMGYLNRTSKGDTLSRITNDVDTLSQSVTQVISLLANAALMFVGSLVMMLVTNVPLALVAIASGLLGVWLTGLISKRSMPYFMRQQQDLGSLNGYIEEIYKSQPIVKAYSQEGASEERFAELNQTLVHDGFVSQALSGLMMPISSFVSNLAYVAVCVAGGLMVLGGVGSFGTIVGFLVYVTYFTQPISRLSQSMQMLMGAAAAGDRVFSFLEEDEPAPQEDLPGWDPASKGDVEFDHVRFAYPGATEPVIRDFSMSAKRGQKIAIVGPTGAGKTTLVNLLMRFYDIDGGSIRIDGTDTRELSRRQVRDCFSMVLQDSWLFEGTLRENLLLHAGASDSAVDVSDERLWEVMRAVGLEHFVEVLPQGFDTQIKSDTALSQGQRQQIAIARAMLEDRPMLILDEATSSVDTRTEYLIQRALDRLMEGRTSFVIAHRLSTIVNADLILVLKDGNVVEQGTHEELLAKGGFYAQMYASSSERAA